MADATKQLKERKCDLCGKSYIYHEKWAYKIKYREHVKNFCSWTCLRKQMAEELGKIERRA